MLDNEASTAHLLHSVRTAEVADAKDRCREAIAVAAENMSAAGMEPKDLPKPAKTFIPYGI